MKAWLRFFRVVNLPTVPGDIWVGAAAVWFGTDIVCDYGAALFNATVAGILLYMFGLADNDIVGAMTDKGRPIPDGRISLRSARIARAACVIGAIAVGLAPDPVALRPIPWAWWPVAFALLCAIVVYNRTKNWALMGLCRGLNVACGGVVAFCASPAAAQEAASPFLWLGVCTAVWTIYIAAVTKYSEGEEMDAAKKRRVGFLVGAVVYLQIIALLCFQSGIVVLVGVLLVVMRLMRRFLPEVSAS
ncbi:MAG: UbiA family prenyltransferase [Kiritimatiellae bacterium]|nr:UbiA family prenyltransferase [Kiritimatiellia bacterium]